MWTVPARWDPGRSHRVLSRVDVWSRGVLIDSVDPAVDDRDGADFTVTQQRVSGVRSSLSMTVPASARWRWLLSQPACEVQPWLGMSWSGAGSDGGVLLPQGVFSVRPPDWAPRGADLQVKANDLWQWVKADDFLAPRASIFGTSNSLAIAHLLQEVHLGEPRLNPLTLDRTANPIITVSRDATVPQLTWDKSRHDTIMALAEAIGAEVFIDPYGSPQIRTLVNPPGRGFKVGDGGTVLDMVPSRDWSAVRNVVVATSTATDVDFPDAVVEVGDVHHPAHRDNLGGRQVEKISSNLWRDYGQAWNAALDKLRKLAMPAEEWRVTCIPDPAREPGDLETLPTPDGVITGVVQSVTHPTRGTSTVVLGLEVEPGL